MTIVNTGLFSIHFRSQGYALCIRCIIGIAHWFLQEVVCIVQRFSTTLHRYPLLRETVVWPNAMQYIATQLATSQAKIMMRTVSLGACSISLRIIYTFLVPKPGFNSNKNCLRVINAQNDVQLSHHHLLDQSHRSHVVQLTRWHFDMSTKKGKTDSCARNSD